MSGSPSILLQDHLLKADRHLCYSGGVDATLKRVVGLIGEADVETRCAALLVLGHLQAADASVVRAAGAALSGKNAVVRDFAIGYFERVRPRDATTYLLPLLDNE